MIRKTIYSYLRKSASLNAFSTFSASGSSALVSIADEAEEIEQTVGCMGSSSSYNEKFLFIVDGVIYVGRVYRSEEIKKNLIGTYPACVVPKELTQKNRCQEKEAVECNCSKSPLRLRDVNIEPDDILRGGSCAEVPIIMRSCGTGIFKALSDAIHIAKRYETDAGVLKNCAGEN